MSRRKGGIRGGSSSFEFEIERFKDKETGELLTEDQVDLKADDENFEFELVTISLEVSGYSYFTPGRYYGPPENCYPDEGETEVEEVTGPDGKDWLPLLTSYEFEAIEQRVVDNSQDEDDYDPPDRDDYDYEPSDSRSPGGRYYPWS